MLEINYPDKTEIDSVCHDGERFWFLTNGGWSVNTTHQLFSYPANDVVPSKIDVLSPYLLTRGPVFLSGHPLIPNPSVVLFYANGTTGINLKTGKEFSAPKKLTPPRLPYQMGTGEIVSRWSDIDNWFKKNMNPYRMVSYSRRSAYNDTAVVMTGSEAEAVGRLVLGPTAYAGVANVKGLRTGHVILHVRGGATRVMKLPGKANPTHVALAADGLTCVAACRNKAFLLDFDAG